MQGAAVGQEQIWSTSEELRSLLTGNLVSAAVQVCPECIYLAEAGCSTCFTLGAALRLLHAGPLAMQVGEVDRNHDGKPDLIHFRARVSSTAPVHSLKLLLQFNYSLKVAEPLFPFHKQAVGLKAVKVMVQLQLQSLG
jgi:hypothetical protein